MLVVAMVGLDARSTMDLDVTIKGANVSVADVDKLIGTFTANPIDDGIILQVKCISEIFWEGQVYYIVHLTWSTGSANFPKYKKVNPDEIVAYLVNDYLYG